jgi:hypothetical protein
MNNVVTTNTNTNVVVVTAPGPAGVQGPQGPQGNTGTITGNTGVNSTGSSIFSGSLNVIGTLLVTGSTNFSGSATLNGAPILTAATLATDRITTTGVTASVSTGNTVFTVTSASVNLFRVTNTGTSGSFIGAFSGSGANLNNIPASGIVGLNLSQIASTTATASISAASGFQINVSTEITGSLKVTAGVSGSVSGSFQGFTTGQSFTTGSLTGSFIGIGSGSFSGSFQGSSNGIQTGQSFTTGSLTGSFTGISSGSFTGIGSGSFSGSFQGNGSGLTNVPASGIVGLNLSQIATGSVSASVSTSNLFFNVSSGSNSYFSVSGSRVTIGSGSLYVSQSINTFNINAGTPTSNNWQSGLGGSYFNNFTSQTDVSEILRFVAGLLSASAPDASPNTKTYSGITENISNSGTTAAPSGYVPQSSTAADLLYLTSKGFTAAGSTLFSGKTIYNNSSYGITYSSAAGGSTIVSSSADAQLFGLGLLSSGNATPLYVSGTINWFYSDNNSEISTATSQSENLLSNSSFGTTSGLTVAKINTANPAVIPAAYQDGKFATILSSGLYNAGRSFTSVSSSGWYHISASITLATGSSTYSSAQSATERIFWAPVSNITIPTQTITFSSTSSNALTATSRSLSGAPYLLTSTFNFGATVNGVFNPMYTADSTVASATEVDSLVTVSGTSTVSTSGGSIQTPNAVFDSTGVTARNTSTVPFETDIIKLTGSLSFDAGNGGSTNISSISLGTTSYVLTFTGKNRSGASTTATRTIPYHSASAFGQPVSSGSLAYYGRTSQTYDGGSLTGQTEAFTGEAYRIQLTDAVTTFTGLAWDNTFNLYNLGGKDLQVKPSNLVKPGGTYKYWLNDPSPSDTFKYYIRRYQRTSVLTSFTLDAGKTLVAWDDVSTNNSVAVGIIFESAKSGSVSSCRLFDPVYANGSRGVLFNSGSAGTNPFTSNLLDYYGAGGSVSGTTYTITVQSATNMVLNGTAGSDEIYVIIRYNGDPSPVTSLTVSGT